MTERSKITSSQRSRLAIVYVRQSTNAQVECNRESTERQYQLRTFAAQLGWPAAAIRVIDQDLGLSGSGLSTRSGFAELTAEVALGHVGIVLALEVSRLARNNADGYRRLDLCGTTDTLIGDADGLYHPGLFNDRLVLGLKGTMSEAELHVLRARLNGGIRNKAARGELRRGLPIGLVWGAADGEVRFHPDAAVTDAIRAVFERFAEMGSALLQGIALCGHCGRKLRVAYSGRSAVASYDCPGDTLANGRGQACVRVGGPRIQQAVSAALLAAVQPAALQAALEAAEGLDSAEQAALAQWQPPLEQARYQAQLAQRRYQRVDPDNRLVARGLETAWEAALQTVQRAEQEVQRRQQHPQQALSAAEREAVLSLADDLQALWSAPSTSDRDRKELLRALLEEVMVAHAREAHQVHLTLRWTGGLISDIDLALPQRAATVRTDEDTVALIRRLAVHYPDAVIAGVLNRQQRTTATGLPFNANRVSSLRTHWGIACFTPPAEPPAGEPVTIREAVAILGVAPSTLHRQLNDGLIAGEQVTPGAPWRILITDALRAHFAGEAPEGYVPIVEAMRRLGVSRQTVLQRVKRGELEAVHVSQGNRKGLRIKVQNPTRDLFDEPASAGG